MNPDLKIAETLPKKFYFDPETAVQESEGIFKTTWQLCNRYITEAKNLQKPGDFFTDEVEGEPVAVVLDDDKKIRVFSNVCRHRASPVLTGSGHCQVMKCPYHGWSYALNGKLIGQPEFGGVENWNREKVSLPELEHHFWGPLLFIKVAKEGPSFAEWVGKIPADLDRENYALDQYTFLTRKEYEMNCNWKVYVDNYLEGYHIPLVHPALFKELDYREYRVDTFRYYSSQYAPLKASGQLKKSADSTGTEARQALYYWLFPNLMLNIYPEQMHTSVVYPMGPEKTKVIFDWFLPKSFKGKMNVEELTAFNDQVQQEDMRICEAVQRGLKSHYYDRGRYSVIRENGVHHFHLLWEEFIAK